MTGKILAGIAICGLAISVLPATAADMPVRAPIAKAPPAAVFNWTGWYIGANYGTAISEVEGSTPDITFGSADRGDDRLSIGAQIGYNWQLDPRWVVGVEADIGWLAIDRNRQDWNDGIQFGIETNWYATARGRLGATNGPSLFFVTAGAAFVDVTSSLNFIGVGSASASETESGWTVGAGIETMLGGNWSSKAEYLYIDVGDQNFIHPAIGQVRFDNRFHVFRKALNYRFGGPAVPASALPAHDWTGFYAGVNLGSGLSQVHGTTPPVFVGSFDIADSGFNGGVQAGYNWQFMPHWVVGIEADIGWLGIDRTSQNWNDTIAFGVEADWYATLRGRLGYSTGPALMYVTGGAAAVKVRNRYDQVTGVGATSSTTASGWVIGSGLEAALGGNWTATTEYLYIDAGSQDVFNAAIGGGTTTRFDNRFHVFRFGLNHKFNTGKAPVVTKG